MQHPKLLFAKYAYASNSKFLEICVACSFSDDPTAWCLQEVHASVAVLLAPGSYMMRHFRAMCSEKRQDFLAARADYNAMALQSKQMHEKVAAHKVGILRIHTILSLHAECMKQICMRTGTLHAHCMLICALNGSKILS